MGGNGISGLKSALSTYFNKTGTNFSKENLQEVLEEVDSRLNPLESKVFGTELQSYVNSNLIISTTVVGASVFSGNFITSTPNADYIMILHGTINSDSTNSDGILDFTYNGNPLSSITGNNEIRRIEMKDQGGNNPTGTGTDQKQDFTFMYILNNQPSGVKPVSLNIRPSVAGTEASCWNINVLFFRIN